MISLYPRTTSVAVQAMFLRSQRKKLRRIARAWLRALLGAWPRVRRRFWRFFLANMPRFERWRACRFLANLAVAADVYRRHRLRRRGHTLV